MAMVCGAALLACTGPISITRVPAPHQVGPVVHVVTNTPPGAPEAVEVFGVDKQWAMDVRGVVGGGDHAQTVARTERSYQQLQTLRFVCGAPCDQTVLARPDQELTVLDDGRLPSRLLRLPPDLGEVTLRVRRSNVQMRSASKIMLPVGALATLVGGLFFLDGLAEQPSYTAPGAAVLAAGVSSVVIGAVLYSISPTRVELIPGRLNF